MRNPLLLLLTLLAGCISPHPSPKDSAIVIDAPKAKVKESAMTFLVAQGWRPVRSDELVTVFQKMGTANDVFAFGELYSQPPKHELSLTFMDNGTNSTRLLGFGCRIHTHYGNEQRNQNVDIYPPLLWHLDGIRATAMGETVEAYKRPVIPPPAETPKPSNARK